MDVFRVRKTRETESTSMGTLDSVHRDIVGGLRDAKTHDAELREEADQLRTRIDALKASNEIADVVMCTTWETRVREIERELSRANPMEDYYMKNMDILMDYYKRPDAVAQPTQHPPLQLVIVKEGAGACSLRLHGHAQLVHEILARAAVHHLRRHSPLPATRNQLRCRAPVAQPTPHPPLQLVVAVSRLRLCMKLPSMVGKSTA